MSQPAVEPDTKDWTWVLQRPCEACGFHADDVDPATLGDRLRADAAGWERRLAGSGVRVRPEAGVWSVLEYACHVRDVHRVFQGRVRLMLDHEVSEVPNVSDVSDVPTFADWDQDATALEGDYPAQDPAVVARELVQAAHDVAATYDAVAGRQWQRRGLRSNGSAFTVASIGAYHLHDVVHHTHDVGPS